MRHPIMAAESHASITVLRTYDHALPSGLIGFEIKTGEAGSNELPEAGFLALWLHLTGVTSNQFDPPAQPTQHVKPSEVSAIGPNATMRGSWRGAHLSFCLGVADHLVEDIMDRSIDIAAYRQMLCLGLEDAQLFHAISAVRQDFQRGSPVGPAFSESVARALIRYSLHRYCALAAPVTVRERLPAAKLRQTQAFIAANLDRNIALAELAANARMSVSRFCALFKASTGLPPHQYLLKARIERARELLADDSQSIAEIASDLGFCDQSQFATTFRRFVGVTPRRYRAG